MSRSGRTQEPYTLSTMRPPNGTSRYRKNVPGFGTHHWLPLNGSASSRILPQQLSIIRLGKKDILWRFPRLRTLKPTLTPPVTHDPSSGNDYVEHHKENSSASPLSPPPTLLQKPMDLPSPTHHTLIHPPILPQPPPIKSLQAIHLGINYVDSPTVKSRRIHPIQSSPPSLSTLLLLDINRRISSSLHPSLLTPSPTLPHQPHSSLLYKLLTP